MLTRKIHHIDETQMPQRLLTITLFELRQKRLFEEFVKAIGVS